jgi:hypothetical protein
MSEYWVWTTFVHQRAIHHFSGYGVEHRQRLLASVQVTTYKAQPRNQRTFGNWLREFVQFMLAPLSPGFNLDRYDRELRRPFPSVPQFATDSKVWRRQHAIAENFNSPAPVHGKAPVAATRHSQRLEF